VSGTGGPPRNCQVCRQRPVAWSTPRVDVCYRCLPGGPFTPPPCKRCGATRDYFSAGLCADCHLFAPQHYDSCHDCLAFGVLRKHRWLCWRCRSWRQRFTRGACQLCDRAALPVDEHRVCFLCRQQTTITLGATLEQANSDGQQLFLANLPWPATHRRDRTGTARRALPANPAPTTRRTTRLGFRPAGHQQEVLFQHLPRDLANAHRRGTLPEPTHPTLAAVLDQAITDHAARHGWPTSTIKRTRQAGRVLQGLQDTPGATLLASDALLLSQVSLTVLPLIDVACAPGLMLDDREPAIHNWFANNTAHLPGRMRAELEEWFDVMLRGSTSTPRRRPRAEITIRLHLRWAVPALTAWSSQGHQTLREVSPDDVRAVLPPSGNPRATMGAGLRSITSVLRARKTLFVDPLARIRTGGYERRQPLPVQVDVIREALQSANPARAALAALTAFHALRAGELREAKVTDLADRRIQVGSRSIPLAGPAQVRIAAWLDYRARRWPATSNPYLFINPGNSNRLGPVGQRWLGLTLGMPARMLREDRILHEIHTSGGDVRRICDLFGLTVAAALRYLPDLEAT